MPSSISPTRRVRRTHMLALGTMRVFAAVLILTLGGNALASSCPSKPKQAEVKSRLNTAFSEAQIVAYVEYLDVPIKDVLEVKVLRVWKGSIGKESFLRGHPVSGLILAERRNDGPLLVFSERFSLDCSLYSLHPSGRKLILEKLQRLWGPGIVPESPNMEQTVSQVQSAWVVSILIGASAIMLVLIGLFSRRSAP